MIRAWALCMTAMLVFGCQSGEEPVRGARLSIERPPVSPLAPAPAPEPADNPEPDRNWPNSDPIVVGTTREETVERDLGAELNAAVGSPTNCVRDYVASSPTTIRVSVSAIVRPTGICIEPTAYGAGLSAAALKCIRDRVSTVVLKPLEDSEKSETAATVIEIEYGPPVIVESDPGVPEPHLKNVVEPLPKRPHIPLIDEGGHGIPIEDPFRGWLAGGDVKHVEGPKPKKVIGPKPRPIDGYEVDENAQKWR